MYNDGKIAIRPKLQTERKQEDSILLVFQNETLRPVLKMQNNTIKALALKHMPKVTAISEGLERRIFCQTFLNKNPLITHLLIGIIVGLFTEEEFKFYIENSAEISKRIKEMLIIRIADALGPTLQ